MRRDLTDCDAGEPAAVGRTQVAAELARWSAYTIAMLLLGGAGTIAWRRLAQALQQPLDGPALALAAAVAAGAATAARVLLGWSAQAGGSRNATPTAHWMLSVCLAAWGLVLSLGSPRFAGLLFVWGVLIGAEAWAWWAVLRRRHGPGELREDRRRHSTGSDPPLSSMAPPHDPISHLTPPCPKDVLQEFVRSRQPGGGELLTGWMRVGLASGQRSATVHLAFCPPFARTPMIRVAQQEGPPSRIKETQVLPFGARLDVKVSQTADIDTTVLLEIVVRADATADPPDPSPNLRPGLVSDRR